MEVYSFDGDVAVSTDIPVAKDDVQKAESGFKWAIGVMVILLCGIGVAYVAVRKKHQTS